MKNLQKLATDVSDTMGISQKENPHIKKAMRDFGAKFIDRLLTQKKFKKENYTGKEKEIIEKLKHPKYGPLVYEIDNICHTKTKISENIRIRYVEGSPECYELAKLIRTICFKRGCHCTITPHDTETDKEFYTIAPDNILFELNPLSVAIVKNTDVSISIGDESDPNWSKGFEKRIAYGSTSLMQFRKIYDQQSIRGALLALPVKRKETYVPQKKYNDIFYESLTASFSEEMKTLIDTYEKKLKNKEQIRITSDDGTDITFSIKNRRILRDDNYTVVDKKRNEIYNFPTGEVFVAPVETSANGKITFDYTTPRGFGLIEDLTLTFKDGKVIDAKAKGDGAKRFRSFLDVNTGEKDRIAELGIGCNPKAQFVGTTIVDEKIYGSIHIAIGFNLGPFHGKNLASSHLDMIKMMKGRNGNVYADNKLIMKNGDPV
ncbi:MAG: hypothetical protein DRN71_01690 [Candidatus Nanohalarchaeota archaeon]|nr:MAG: hypothetical protein DRN71_01690 [Candidatus Nanohaloarchaeota archaeon]